MRVADNVHVDQFLLGDARHAARPTPGSPTGIRQDVRDPELIAEAKKADLEVEPIDGPTTAKSFAKFVTRKTRLARREIEQGDPHIEALAIAV